MGKIILYALIISAFTFIACGGDDDVSPTTSNACDNATAVTAAAKTAYDNASSATFNTKCNDYKAALQAQKVACGDSNGTIQAIIDGLGTCTTTGGGSGNLKKYDTDVAPIIASNCLNCHGATPTNGAYSSFNTYNLVKTGVQSGNILNRINNTGNPMPPSGLMLKANRDVIQQWLDDGLLEN